jgi:hypothetical protein
MHEIPHPEPLFHHLFRGDRGYLVTASSDLSVDDDWEQRSWRYPERANEAASWIIEEAQRARDTFFCVHLLKTARNRQKANALEHVRALWLDVDEGHYPEEGPVPTAVVRSSAVRQHLYFRLCEPVPATWAEELNGRLCRFAAGDETKKCLSSVLRPSGTCNFKREKPELVVGYLTGVEAWEPAVIDQAIPPIPEPEAPPRPRGPYTGPELALAPYLQAVEVLGEVPDTHGVKFRIVCPWSREHSHGDRSGTRLGKRSSGALWFHCDHAHCQGRGWPEFKAEVIKRWRSPVARRGGITIEAEAI